jgi:branched-subunit amino acid ABC-type transport system permease component
VSEFLSFALPGIPSGCTFALVAVGLVLAYRATGIFNFAFGAEAYGAGILYSEMTGRGVAPALAAALVVLLAAPAFGALLDFAFFSRIPTGNDTAKVVVSLGVMVMLPQVIQMLTGPVNVFGGPPPFISATWFHRWGLVSVNGSEMSTIVSTLVVFAGLTVLLRTRRFGLPMRAAVESPKLLELNGVDSRWVLRSAWMLSTGLAGLAGVLFASQLTIVYAQNYSIVLVAAIAAAALGGLRNMPLAVLGGLGLGAVQGVVEGYLPNDTIWYQALVPSLPFFILLVLLVLHPGLRRLQDSSDPMIGVEPPPPTPALALRPPQLNRVIHRFRWPILVVAVVVTVTFISGLWITALTIGAATAIVFLSITLMTGIAGQLSLAQAAFAGIGACTAAQLADAQHVPILVAALAGSLVAGLGGVLASLPALRLRGLPIALLTLCLALLADNLLFPTSWIGNGEYGLVVPRPHVFGIDMTGVSSKAFFILVFAVLLAVTGMVHALLRGTTGRALAAVHASPTGALSAGVPVRRLTILLFMLSASIAGLGGAFYAMCFGQENPVDFNWMFGPTFLVIVVTVGVSTVEGAIEAGMAFALITQAVSYLPARVASSSGGSATITILLLSLGAFTYAKHPEGIVEYLKRVVAQVLLRARPHSSTLTAATPVDSQVRP